VNPINAGIVPLGVRLSGDAYAKLGSPRAVRLDYDSYLGVVTVAPGAPANGDFGVVNDQWRTSDKIVRAADWCQRWGLSPRTHQTYYHARYSQAANAITFTAAPR
jgi:hypothetical protein